MVAAKPAALVLFTLFAPSVIKAKFAARQPLPASFKNVKSSEICSGQWDPPLSSSMVT